MTTIGLAVMLAAVCGAQVEPDTRTIRVPNTTVSLTLVRCPADGDARELWVLETEVPWELYDIFVYSLDVPEDEKDADAVARPSKPYVPPDRGFGHDGYPAMGMTRDAAAAFCEWLGERIGLALRLPTEAEFARFADADDASVWHAGNADRSTHPVQSKPANHLGLFGTRGNVAEWVSSDERRPVAMGGSYLDPIEACAPDAKQTQQRSWNASDPQIPKSKWWLADCSWVGFRFVTQDTPTESTPEEE